VGEAFDQSTNGSINWQAANSMLWPAHRSPRLKTVQNGNKIPDFSVFQPTATPGDGR
jgi:hypothetical protein